MAADDLTYKLSFPRMPDTHVARPILVDKTQFSREPHAFCILVTFYRQHRDL